MRVQLSTACHAIYVMTSYSAVSSSIAFQLKQHLLNGSCAWKVAYRWSDQILAEQRSQQAMYDLIQYCIDDTLDCELKQHLEGGGEAV